MEMKMDMLGTALLGYSKGALVIMKTPVKDRDERLEKDVFLLWRSESSCVAV